MVTVFHFFYDRGIVQWKNNWNDTETLQGVGVCLSRTLSSGSLGHTKD